MTMLFRPGGAQLHIPGIEVLQPRASASAADWWDVPGQTCVAAYAPKGAVDLAASYINLTGNATYNAAPGVAPTWDATGGWTFNGSTQYLLTGVVPAAGWTMIVRFSNAITGSLASARIANLNSQFLMLFTVGGEIRYGYGNQSDQTVSLVAAGVVALAGGNAYLDGASVATVSGTFGGAVPAIFIGATNSAGSPFIFLNGKIQAIAIYSTTLSAGNVATLTTLMAAL